MKLVSPLLLETSTLTLSMAMVPWDSEVFGFPVATIDCIRVKDCALASLDFQLARAWLDLNQVRLASCRLPHDRFAESFLLESEDFRFIEMVLHPRFESLNSFAFQDGGLAIVQAVASDLTNVVAIAESTFGNERFHVDPRVDTGRANARYGNWVASCLEHPRQLLLKVMDGDELVALFVVEMLESGTAYWHLTAVAAHLQGQGYGWRSWCAMMHHHQMQGVTSIETTISARNSRVLNLYARLGFRFLPPETTFHYVR